MKTVKSVTTRKFSVDLIQSGDNYFIRYEKAGQEPKLSEAIKDYGIASKLFEMKHQEFEGH